MAHNLHHLQTTRTARYYTNNPDTTTLHSVLFILHGYAQLAEEFLKEFEDFDNKNVLIVAPEGLSRFYFRNKTGASWMTKEDREHEIVDYISYLEKLYEEVSNNFKIVNSKINILGFSQGVHTAVRWFLKSKNDFHKLILYSSGLPNDTDYAGFKIKSKSTVIFYARGMKDDIIPKEDFSLSIDNLKKNDIRFNEILFEGKHEVDNESLKLILSE